MSMNLGSEHIGSDFDGFLREDGTQEEVTAAALRG